MERYAVLLTSSSESMEKEAAVEIFARSSSLRNLQYRNYFGDVDSFSFGEVCEAMRINMVMIT